MGFFQWILPHHLTVCKARAFHAHENRFRPARER